MQSGLIVTIDEILAQGPALACRAVRTTGRMHAYDLESGLVALVQGASAIKVDPTCCGQVAPRAGEHVTLRAGSLYQVIGDIEWRQSCPPEIVLKARVFQNVDGRDGTLYERAVETRRDFEDKYNHLLLGSLS